MRQICSFQKDIFQTLRGIFKCKIIWISGEIVKIEVLLHYYIKFGDARISVNGSEILLNSVSKS